MIPIYPLQDLPDPHAPRLGDNTLSGLKNPPPLALYIHIPWCVRKCPYCDFNSHEQKAELPEKAYVDGLIADLEQATPLVWGRKVSSVFFGGGTPSLFSAEAIDRILSHVRMLTPLEFQAEITLEANPGTVDSAHFAGYRDAGINRISLGIQSFNAAHLQALGRIHDPDQAIMAAELALAMFETVNLDVMYGLPEQTLAQALADAEAACALGAAHLSFYHLTLEPNTPFHRQPPVLPSDELAADMQIQIESLLAQQGYVHYETSAFAKPGRLCRHNLNYWMFGDYLGIGAGAHSKLSFHDRIIRQSRHKHPKRYLESVRQGSGVDEAHDQAQAGNFIGERYMREPYIAESWQIPREELAFEFMMNALRLTEGVDTSLFEQRTGLPLQTIHATLRQAQQKNLLQVDQRLVPTALGQRFLNDLLGLFLP